MTGDNRHVWEENGFADLLVEDGNVVVAVDIRNQGDSGGDPNWESGEVDMRRWWNYFSGCDYIDSTRTTSVGDSIGANLALFTGYQIPIVRTVVLLSPSLDYNNADLEGAMTDYGELSVLVVVSEDDLFPTSEDARILAGLIHGEAETQIYMDAGNGTNMISAKPELAGLIIDWLDQQVKENR
jgi:hypothetical protein